MKADPFADPFFIPSDRAVMILHDRFQNSAGRVALIAPTFKPGLSHFGIAAVIGREWEFISGPAIIRTKQIWRKLLQLDGFCPTAAVLFEKEHDWSIPSANPAHLVDLVNRREEA